MVTLTLSLSDELAEKAEKWGLLSPIALETYIKSSFNRLSSAHSGTQAVKPLLSLRGIDKDRDTMEAYFKRHHADNERERAADRQRQ
ncbi:hypothetical protein AGMMS50293_12030 [Spirochaetia bacterium]|nr:hypothetical protein AGMMS50293_12030 [Spirochaetia bacterium]